MISYDLPVSAKVTLSIYGVTGRLLRTLVSGELQEAGTHRVVWDGRDDRGEPVPSGFYFSHLSTEQGTKIERMVLIR
jgi:flagellar hook assembly protein FlgD